jgi:hypothetical protein
VTLERRLSGEEFMERPADIDLGGGVRVWWVGRHGTDDRHAGLMIEHPPGPGPAPGHKDSCVGISALEFKPHNLSGWDLKSADPLTIAPSIHCLGCGWHVYIRGGKVEVC